MKKLFAVLLSAVSITVAALKFFDWAYTSGDKSADDLDYVPLPDAVKNHIRADWKRLGLN